MIDQAQSTGTAKSSGSANETFKHSFSLWFWGSISAATLMHFLVFAFWPSMQVVADSVDTRETEVVTPPVWASLDITFRTREQLIAQRG